MQACYLDQTISGSELLHREATKIRHQLYQAATILAILLFLVSF